MKKTFAIFVVIEMVVTGLLLNSEIKDFFWTHPWWHSFLVLLPAIAVPILAYFELGHSREANALRAQNNKFSAEANHLRSEANDLRAQNVALTAELDSERNKHLGKIAQNIEKQVTDGERNAAILRKHLGHCAAVKERGQGWPGAPQIVEVSDANIVTFFTPHGSSSDRAFCIFAKCDDLEISEFPQGSCPLRITVSKRYADTVYLGEITKWEDRDKPEATPKFDKGDTKASPWATGISLGDVNS